MSAADEFEFVGPVCHSRRGRDRRWCLLPVLHDGDHEDREGKWHPRPPHKLGQFDQPEPIESKP